MEPKEVILHPLTLERIIQQLKQMNVRFAVQHEDTGVMIPYPGFNIFISQLADTHNGNSLVIFGQWGRRINVAYIALAKNLVQAAASSTYAPRLAFKVTDDGFIIFSTSWQFQWNEVGVTDQQCAEELTMALAGTALAMERLEHHFPDPWLHPAEEPKVD